jgi:hypothetical protein
MGYSSSQFPSFKLQVPRFGRCERSWECPIIRTVLSRAATAGTDSTRRSSRRLRQQEPEADTPLPRVARSPFPNADTLNRRIAESHSHFSRSQIRWQMSEVRISCTVEDSLQDYEDIHFELRLGPGDRPRALRLPGQDLLQLLQPSMLQWFGHSSLMVHSVLLMNLACSSPYFTIWSFNLSES